jgi:TPR repeat protein
MKVIILIVIATSLAGVVGYVYMKHLEVDAEAVETGVVAFKKGDYKTAVEILEPYSIKGNETARLTLGMAYAFGHGVSRDREKAKALLQSSTDGKTAEFYFWIGRSFEKGDGVEKNILEAKNWYQIAAEAGYLQARKLVEPNASVESLGE